ncbi:MAG: hypothetical protein MK291_05865 [Planctomycetes bacterium]|nr:hypothetical protein [Planctomycetota bacterium]
MAKKGKVLNNLGRPKLLRKEIPAGEALVGVALLLSLVGMGVWLGDQRTNYDPGERDIETSLLVEQSVEDNLYRIPLKRWRDPSLGGGDEAPMDVGPFSKDILAGGWTPASTPKTFVPDTLYEKINGQAEQYLKFGFEDLVVVELEHPEEGCAVDVFLYDQGSFEGSLGVYGNQRGDRDVAELEEVRYSPHAMGAIGMRGEIFFHVTGDSAVPAVEEMTQRVVEALAAEGGEDVIPPGFRRLNEDLGVPFAQIAYQPVNVFQYRFAERFWFGKPDPSSDERLFIHEADSADAATALFEKLHEELLADYKSLPTEDGEVLLQHNFLDTFFCLMREGEMVYGVERAQAREDAALAMARLQGSFGGEEVGGEEAGYYADEYGGEY